jgi:hypothetical protein
MFLPNKASSCHARIYIEGSNKKFIHSHYYFTSEEYTVNFVNRIHVKFTCEFLQQAQNCFFSVLKKF